VGRALDPSGAQGSGSLPTTPSKRLWNKPQTTFTPTHVKMG